MAPPRYQRRHRHPQGTQPEFQPSPWTHPVPRSLLTQSVRLPLLCLGPHCPSSFPDGDPPSSQHAAPPPQPTFPAAHPAWGCSCLLPCSSLRCGKPFPLPEQLLLTVARDPRCHLAIISSIFIKHPPYARQGPKHRKTKKAQDSLFPWGTRQRKPRTGRGRVVRQRHILRPKIKHRKKVTRDPPLCNK